MSPSRVLILLVCLSLIQNVLSLLHTEHLYWYSKCAREREEITLTIFWHWVCQILTDVGHNGMLSPRCGSKGAAVWRDCVLWRKRRWWAGQWARMKNSECGSEDWGCKSGAVIPQHLWHFWEWWLQLSHEMEWVIIPRTQGWTPGKEKRRNESN